MRHPPWFYRGSSGVLEPCSPCRLRCPGACGQGSPTSCAACQDPRAPGGKGIILGAVGLSDKIELKITFRLQFFVSLFKHKDIFSVAARLYIELLHPKLGYVVIIAILSVRRDLVMCPVVIA